ncbi:MAG: FAD-binding oxidoreductase, partial [Candidatus Aminicenantia bacterium]
VGEKGIIYEDRDALENYSRDESGKYYFHIPDIVLKPTSSNQISQILKIANRERIPVTPRGAGSGLSGGCIPICGGIVLSLERMNRLIEVDKTNMVAIVEPGMITNELCQLVSKEGLFYAGYPMSVEISFIGGNVATNAGGGKVIKYGNTGKHVLGLEAVLADGEIVQFGGKRRKDSSGYNFVQFLIGSEGTLAVFTKIFLNLIPNPGRAIDFLISFENTESAISTIEKIFSEARTIPSSLEFIDRISVEIGKEFSKVSIPISENAEAFLIVQFEEDNENKLFEIGERISETLARGGAIDVLASTEKASSERIWKIRRNWIEALKSIDPYVLSGDVVVPPSKIPETMNFIKEISKEFDVKIPVAGHAGDGNLHPALMKPDRISPEKWKEFAEEILKGIALKAAELGGAVSGEHGIGFLKKELLKITKRKEWELMKKIKEDLDPNNILNPGKLF